MVEKVWGWFSIVTELKCHITYTVIQQASYWRDAQWCILKMEAIGGTQEFMDTHREGRNTTHGLC